MDGAELKRLREWRGWTLRELAERSGVDFSAIGAIERGQRRPRPGTLHKLLDALGDAAPTPAAGAAERAFVAGYLIGGNWPAAIPFTARARQAYQAWAEDADMQIGEYVDP